MKVKHTDKSQPKRVLRKVIFEYDDEISTLKGDDAVKWLEATNSNTTIAYVHGMNAYDNLGVKWEVTKKGPTS